MNLINLCDKENEPAPSADEISSSDEKNNNLIISDKGGVVKMNDEKLTQLNELSEKIKTKKSVLEKIDALYKKNRIVVTDYNSGRVELPEELRNVFFTLLRDFYKKQLDALEKQFEAM